MTLRGHLALVALFCVITGACTGGRASTTPVDPPPLVSVADGAGSVTIAAGRPGATAVDLPADLRAKVAPLVAARTFAPTEGDDVYGLDHPVATLTYRDATGRAIAVDLGGTTFDAHGVYARRQGVPTVSTVLADDVRAVLALVGVTLPAPS